MPSPTWPAAGMIWQPDTLGWLAAALMVATFGCRSARAMRPLAVVTNLAFIGYGAAASLAPVLALHLLLLPINLWRWAELLRRDPAGTRRASLGMGASGARMSGPRGPSRWSLLKRAFRARPPGVMR